MNPILAIVLILAAVAIGVGAGYLLRKNVAEKQIKTAEDYAKKLLDDATRKAVEIKKETELEKP